MWNSFCQQPQLKDVHSLRLPDQRISTKPPAPTAARMWHAELAPVGFSVALGVRPQLRRERAIDELAPNILFLSISGFTKILVHDFTIGNPPTDNFCSRIHFASVVGRVIQLKRIEITKKTTVILSPLFSHYRNHHFFYCCPLACCIRQSNSQESAPTPFGQNLRTSSSSCQAGIGGFYSCAFWQVTYPHDSAKGSVASSRMAAWGPLDLVALTSGKCMARHSARAA